MSEDVKGCLIAIGSVLSIIVIVALVIWYQVFFAQNCLKSHSHYYTSYVSHCVAYTKKGSCASSILLPQENSEQICDQWKKS